MIDMSPKVRMKNTIVSPGPSEYFSVSRKTWDKMLESPKFEFSKCGVKVAAKKSR
jgi:hypothetical protein